MKKILVVEDEHYARKSIVKILQESDLDIQVCGEAENGMKAIELLEEYKDIALVITDIQMQKMGGLELASYLHKHIPEIDVLRICSRYLQREHSKSVHSMCWGSRISFSYVYAWK